MRPQLAEHGTPWQAAIGLARRYAEEGGFLDWARQSLRGMRGAGDELMVAVRRLSDAVDVIARTDDKRFAEAYVAWVNASKPSSEVLPIEHVTKRVVAQFLKGGEHRRLLLVLMDGMSYAAAVQVLQRLRDQRRWSPIAWRMPGWNGLAALPELLTQGRGAKILVVSSTARAGAEATMRALAAGAADTLAKPAVGQLNQSFQTILVDRIERLGRASLDANDMGRLVLRPEPASPIALLGIGASTGGLSALAAFFAELPLSFSAPIVVTQHLPPAFMPYFADQLAAISGRSTHVAEAGRDIDPGEIAVAPGTRHLLVARRGTRITSKLSDAPTPTRCCPSVDPMLDSMADAVGADAAAVILTGMGRDGTIGSARLVAAGGSVLVQDRASSAVWGMPGSVANAGLASVVATPARLAAHIARRGSL